MRKLLRGRRSRGLVIMVLAILGSLFVAPAPAQAFSPNPVAYWIAQNGQTCLEASKFYKLNMFYLHNTSGVCSIEAPDFNKTFLEYTDVGGQNVAVEVVSTATNTKEGWINFRAYAEYLDIDDTVDNGDSFYVWIGGNGPYGEGHYNLNLADGTARSFEITDDAAGTDVIAASWSTGGTVGILPLIHP